MTSATPAAVNSHSAAALHARFQAGTRAAREAAAAGPLRPARRRRIRAAEVWRMLGDLQVSGPVVDPTLSRDRALRRILSLLLDEATGGETPIAHPTFAQPVLVVRSGPWPVLRTLLEAVAAAGDVPPITVLCHHRDAEALATLGTALALDLQPLFYPRFGPFDPDALLRVIDAAAGAWAATVVLDASPTGTGRALEHLTHRLNARDGQLFVWNGGRQLRRLRPLRESLGRERYELVRRLLRWRAATTA